MKLLYTPGTEGTVGCSIYTLERLEEKMRHGNRLKGITWKSRDRESNRRSCADSGVLGRVEVGRGRLAHWSKPGGSTSQECLASFSLNRGCNYPTSLPLSLCFSDPPLTLSFHVQMSLSHLTFSLCNEKTTIRADWTMYTYDSVQTVCHNSKDFIIRLYVSTVCSQICQFFVHLPAHVSKPLLFLFSGPFV